MGFNSNSGSPAINVLRAPLQALLAFLAPRPAPTFCDGEVSNPVQSRSIVKPTSKASRRGATGTASVSRDWSGKPARLRSGLRVVREFEAGVHPACAGRMVISGRMADVCAELERMALREASFH